MDGTKVEANASKHAAVSHKRAGEMLEQLELEVLQLTAKAEQADSTPLDEGMTVPAETERREDRKAVLAEGRRDIEERFAERREVQRK